MFQLFRVKEDVACHLPAGFAFLDDRQDVLYGVADYWRQVTSTITETSVKPG